VYCSEEHEGPIIYPIPDHDEDIPECEKVRHVWMCTEHFRKQISLELRANQGEKRLVYTCASSWWGMKPRCSDCKTGGDCGVKGFGQYSASKDGKKWLRRCGALEDE
jgi:hypothetical protein